MTHPRLKTVPPLPQQSLKEEALRNQSVRIVPPQRGWIWYIVLLQKEKNKRKIPINTLRCYFLVRNNDWTYIYAFMYTHKCTYRKSSYTHTQVKAADPWIFFLKNPQEITNKQNPTQPENKSPKEKTVALA